MPDGGCYIFKQTACFYKHIRNMYVIAETCIPGVNTHELYYNR